MSDSSAAPDVRVHVHVQDLDVALRPEVAAWVEQVALVLSYHVSEVIREHDGAPYLNLGRIDRVVRRPLPAAHDLEPDDS